MMSFSRRLLLSTAALLGSATGLAQSTPGPAPAVPDGVQVGRIHFGNDGSVQTLAPPPAPLPPLPQPPAAPEPVLGADGRALPLPLRAGQAPPAREGVRYRRVGSTLFGNDGSTYLELGGRVIGSDGRLYRWNGGLLQPLPPASGAGGD